jgi:hypothetical protein
MAGMLTFLVFQHSVALLFGSVLLITAIFLIARVARLSQPLSLAIALSPMAFALALDGAILPAMAAS